MTSFPFAAFKFSSPLTRHGGLEKPTPSRLPVTNQSYAANQLISCEAGRSAQRRSHSGMWFPTNAENLEADLGLYGNPQRRG